jgi:tetratricopeptide (TPR) repeat protein
LDSARLYLEAAVIDEPANHVARLGLARLYGRTGEPDKAREHLEYILEQQGGVGSAYFLLSEIWRNKGDDDKVHGYLALFEKHRGVGIPIHDPLMGELIAMDLSEKPLLREAGRLNEQGRTGEAIEMLNRALERNPNSHLTRAALVGAYGALGQFDKVDEQYRLALASAPPTAPLLRNLARARFYQGKFEEARLALEQALAINPHDAEAAAWLGIVYLRQNKLEQGIAMLSEAVQQDPRNKLAQMVLAETLHKLGRNEEALVHLRELVVPEQKSTPHAWRLMGEAYTRLGKIDDARTAYAAAIASAERLNDAAEARISASLLDGISR